MVSEAKELGWSQYGLWMLQPSPSLWSIETLVLHEDTHGLTILDPYLTEKLHSYINCQINGNPGFNIQNYVEVRRNIAKALVAKRQEIEYVTSCHPSYVTNVIKTRPPLTSPEQKK